MSVRPSVRPQATTRLPLDRSSWNLIFGYFSKTCGTKLKFHQYVTRTPLTSHKDQHTFLITSCSFLVRTRNVHTNGVEKNRNTHFVFSYFEHNAVCEVMWNNTEQPDRQQVTVWLNSSDYKHTLTILLFHCNNCCCTDAPQCYHITPWLCSVSAQAGCSSRENISEYGNNTPLEIVHSVTQ
jgi:hypothetical protein